MHFYNKYGFLTEGIFYLGQIMDWDEGVKIKSCTSDKQLTCVAEVMQSLNLLEFIGRCQRNCPLECSKTYYKVSSELFTKLFYLFSIYSFSI